MLRWTQRKMAAQRAPGLRALVVVGLGWLAPVVGVAPVLAAEASAANAGERQVVASLDGEPIYRDQLSPEIAFQIYRLEAQAHELLLREIEATRDELLLAREASRRGLDLEEMLRLEVEEKVPPVSPAEIERYLEENPARTVGPEEARERVAVYLREVRRLERREELLVKLRSQSRFAVRLDAPEAPRVHLEIADAPTRGDQEAPVLAVLFGGFDPASVRGVSYLERLAKELPGSIRWAYQPYLRMYDELGLEAAGLALAAQEQDRFWTFHDRLIAHAGHFSREELEALSQDLGIAGMDDGEARERRLLRLRELLTRAQRSGVTHPGVIFVNGRYFSSTFPYRDLKGLVEEELAALAGAGEPKPRPDRAPQEPVTHGGTSP